MHGNDHLAEALRWSTGTEVEWDQGLSAAAGMAVPVLLAAAAGHISLGLAASAGSLVASGVGAGSSAREQAQELASVLAPAALASLAAVLASGHGWLSDAILVVLACAAATLGGYSRPAVAAAMRFVLFLVIIIAVADATPNRAGLVLLIAAGALWTSVVSLLLGVLIRRRRRPAATAASANPQNATAAQKFARWSRSLKSLAGWQYTLRLGFCLGIAGLMRSLWPEHHLHWIALTVAILLQRQIDSASVKSTQRTLGTALGVLAASLFLAFQPPAWGLGLCIGLLAGLRPWLKARNYLAYSAVMAPLVLLLLDGGGPLHAGVLIDRLLATLVGAALVAAANAIMRRVLQTPA